MLGTACAAAGAAALNLMAGNAEVDALMDRTKDRPVPAGRIGHRPRHWLPGLFYRFWGSFILPSPAIVSALSSPRSRLWIYVFAYTPLKRISNFTISPGFCRGCASSISCGGRRTRKNRFLAERGVFFTIIFPGQLPHFFAISWMCREDYSGAGFQMISND